MIKVYSPPPPPGEGETPVSSMIRPVVAGGTRGAGGVLKVDGCTGVNRDRLSRCLLPLLAFKPLGMAPELLSVELKAIMVAAERLNPLLAVRLNRRIDSSISSSAALTMDEDSDFATEGCRECWQLLARLPLLLPSPKRPHNVVGVLGVLGVAPDWCSCSSCSRQNCSFFIPYRSAIGRIGLTAVGGNV